MKYIEGLMDDFMMGRDTAVTLGKFDGKCCGYDLAVSQKSGTPYKRRKKRTFKKAGSIMLDRLPVPSGDCPYESGKLYPGCTGKKTAGKVYRSGGRFPFWISEKRGQSASGKNADGAGI